MISLQNISKKFDDTTVLNNVNVTFEADKTYAIIGSSGAGKSTLLRCINLLEKPTQGQVVVDGIDIVKEKGQLYSIREKIGRWMMVFCSFQLSIKSSFVPKRIKSF